MISGMAKSPSRLAREIGVYLSCVGKKAVADMPSDTSKMRLSRIFTRFAAIKKAANMTDLRTRFRISSAMWKRMEALAEAGSLLADDEVGHRRKARARLTRVVRARAA
jgi:hypothetical protein